MKKFYFALAAAAAIFAGCSKEVDNPKVEPVVPNEKATSLKASVGDSETKVSSDNTGLFKWQNGDVITVVTKEGEIRHFETSEDGTVALFSGTIPEGDEIGGYAFYPASISHVAVEKNISFNLDDDVKWKADASNMPMLGKVSGASASFKAVGGVLKLILFNIPSEADYLQFSATNKQITGAFEIEDATIDDPVIVTAAKGGNNNELLINFADDYSPSKVFYIPLPTGTIDGFTVAVLDDNLDELFSVTSDKELAVAANKLIIAPAMNCSTATVLWSEDFSSYSTGNVPSGGTYSYVCVDGGSDTKIYDEKLANGTKPELLVGKSTGKFTAVVPTNDAGTLTLKYKTNANELSLSSATEGVTFSPSSTNTAEEHTVTVSNSKNASSISITFAATGTKNVRLDDIVLSIPGKGFTAPAINTGDVTALTIALGETSVSTPVSLDNAVDGLGISVVLSGTDAAKFTAALADGNLTVTAVEDANNSENAYNATVTLKASGAAAKVINITQESAFVSNPDVAVTAANARFSANWDAVDHATAYVAYLHTAETETPATGGTDISKSIVEDDGVYSITDYAVVNDTEYHLYVKVSAVETGYTIPSEYVHKEFTPVEQKGTLDNPYSVAEAIANTPSTVTSDNVYIHGIVSAFYGTYSSITSDYSHRYYISDDGTTTTQLLVYNGKGLNNVAFSSADDLLIGDEVIIYGGLTTYNSTKEVAAGNYIVSRIIKCAAPVFSLAEGTYYAAQNVTITSSTAGATIYYTTDGTEPTTGSTEYTGPIAVSSTTTIKAVAVKEGCLDSEVASAAYTIEEPTKLATPSVECTAQTHNSLTFSWDAVENANGYKYSLDGTNWSEKISATSYTWTGLDAETEYTFYVRANGSDNGQYTDSDMASAKGTTESAVTLMSIEITTWPTKLEYTTADTELDLTGMVVTAYYSNSSSQAVTGYEITTNVAELLATAGEDKEVVVSYTEGAVNVTDSFLVDVTEAPTEQTYTYTFTNKSWGDSKNSWSSGKDGNQLTSGRGVQITTGASGANATTKSSFTGVSKVVVTYSTNASNGAGSIAIKVGSNTAHSQNVTKTGGTTDRTLTYNISPSETGNVKITVTCTTNSIYVKSVAITAQ